MSATIQQICRYPVKGLNAEVLESVVLTPGQGLPDDRRFAVVYGLGTGAKRGFFDLVQEERLAQLRVAYDPFAPTVTLSRQGRQVVSGNPTDQTRSEEHTSELQSLMRISYAVFCLKKKTQQK